MHPINNRNFGKDLGKIKITFHNGTSVVDGYIVKQVGAARFVVAVDGSLTQYTVTLAQTTAQASALTAGLATIKMTQYGSSTVEYVKGIQSAIVNTTADKSYPWFLGTASKAGQANLAVIAPPPPPPPVTNTNTTSNTNTVQGG